tara:strand:+ start:276 stop:581 length:306 start_codon:yes stop_codon:yes gene_type:complete
MKAFMDTLAPSAVSHVPAEQSHVVPEGQQPSHAVQQMSPSGQDVVGEQGTFSSFMVASTAVAFFMVSVRFPLRPVGAPATMVGRKEEHDGHRGAHWCLVVI